MREFMDMVFNFKNRLWKFFLKRRLVEIWKVIRKYLDGKGRVF